VSKGRKSGEVMTSRRGRQRERETGREEWEREREGKGRIVGTRAVAMVTT
jgi:hypothetical protein